MHTTTTHTRTLLTRHAPLAARVLFFALLVLSLVTVSFRPAPSTCGLVSTTPFRSQNEHEEIPHDGQDGGKASGSMLARSLEQRRLSVPRTPSHGRWWADRVAETPRPARPRRPHDVPLPLLDFVSSSLGLRAPPRPG